MLTALLHALLALPASVITVDDDGPAQFSSIGAALAAAQPGDVLFVAPGNYHAFALDKDVTLLGPASGPRPRVAGLSHVTGTADFVLSGFDMQALDISTTAGHGVVDDCLLGWNGDAGAQQALAISAIPQLVVSRCTVDGRNGTGGLGVRVSQATVDFVACDLEGGMGYSPLSGHGGSGGDALEIEDGSFVRVAGSTARGGEGGYGVFASDGDAGDGLVVDDSTVLARGTADDWFQSGYWSPGWGPPGQGLVVTGGTLIYSGISYDELQVTLPGKAKAATVIEPFVRSGGTPPAAPATLLVHGPAGAPGLLLVSTSAGSTPLAKLESPLGMPVAGSFVLPVVTAGQETPVLLSAWLPPGALHVGTVLRAQAVFPTLPSTLAPGHALVSNEAVIVLRF